MNIFKKLVAYTRWYYAIKKADSEHERTGERYYVIAGNGKDLVVTDRRVFRKLKQKGYISRQANVNDMIRECFYFTPYKNGDGFITKEYLTRKREQYFSYLKALAKKDKAQQRKQTNKKKAA